jgi:formamidopyrimidine-DNA glycosylase
MPELPEVEVLVRHLDPLLRNKTIRAVQVRRGKVIAPSSPHGFGRVLRGAKFTGVGRRGKYLLFKLRAAGRLAPYRSADLASAFPGKAKPTASRRSAALLVGHLGMTGRIYLLPSRAPLPKHTAVVINLGRTSLVFEDTRYFGRLTLDGAALSRLGPEPLGTQFSTDVFLRALRRSRQPIKVRLLDQSLVAGIGNIYASEALFRAGIAPTLPARKLTRAQTVRLRRAIRAVLREAIACGSTVPLDYAGTGRRDGLFYFGRAPGAPDYYEERLRVYDRAGRPCGACGTAIKRCVQAARSSFYCPRCQRR